METTGTMKQRCVQPVAPRALALRGSQEQKTCRRSMYKIACSSRFVHPLSTVFRVGRPRRMERCCSACNRSSQDPSCVMCSAGKPSRSPPQNKYSSSSSSFSSLSPSSSQWPCRACTFLNPLSVTKCEVCTTPKFVSLPDDDVFEGSVGSVFRPLQRCSEQRETELDQNRPILVEDTVCVESGSIEYANNQLLRELHAEKRARTEATKPNPSVGLLKPCSKQDMLKILTYNVWFREDLELNERMRAIGLLIREHDPDFICFQEVTPNIYEIFKKSSWWRGFRCSVTDSLASARPYFCIQLSKLPVKAFRLDPFTNSRMGRELCVAEIAGTMGKQLAVATSHLESPCPAPPRWDEMYSAERVAQAKESIQLLETFPNVIFCGDMNWDDKLDGSFPLRDGWVDAWLELHPTEDGWTYDTKSNPMLSANRKLQKRLDRVLCKFSDFQIASVDMIGKETIPALTYSKEKKIKNKVQSLLLPVLLSDHYGLLLKIQKKQ